MAIQPVFCEFKPVRYADYEDVIEFDDTVIFGGEITTGSISNLVEVLNAALIVTDFTTDDNIKRLEDNLAMFINKEP